ncbi:IS200/IS605 family accessory protein TnpB-related protein [Streptomyces sp. NPDC002994]|uniref:IS200/IS605 family accessory protein TnpB-related protein n=1 Tax=Streptomyces sp. NPDC002994 TaxID=3154441 RepID=UPI0033B6B0F5
MRELAASFVVPGPSGVAIRDRLRVSDADKRVLSEVGMFLGALASGDLAARARQGLEHDGSSWTSRKRELTGRSSSRWAGSITKATHDLWALARRGQAAHVTTLRAGIAAIEARLAQPLGAKANKKEGTPRGYGSRREWHAKCRRLHTLKTRLAGVETERDAGRVHVVRGGKGLANSRHHLAEAGLDLPEWQARWAAARMFLAADGESGKRFGNETIRITVTGQVAVRLPTPLAHLANAPHGRYILDATVTFPHRGAEWRDRIGMNRAVAYRIHHDVERGRWYVTASWQRTCAPTLPLDATLVRGLVGVDVNDDHLAAWHLDPHGNPTGEPQRFFYDLSGNAAHRDAQIRHALSRLLHFTRRCGAVAIAVENLDFSQDKTREKHGRSKRFRRLISRFPTAKLRARLVSMAAEQNVAIVAVDPAYTSRWGAQHWQKPLTTPRRETSRHDAAGIAIGRRAQGYPIRRRTAPPRCDQSDRSGHRTAQAAADAPGREGNRPPATDRPPGGPSPSGTRKRRPSASSTVRDARSDHGLAHAH